VVFLDDINAAVSGTTINDDIFIVFERLAYHTLNRSTESLVVIVIYGDDGVFHLTRWI
jgi:hypothetical protein